MAPGRAVGVRSTTNRTNNPTAAGQPGDAGSARTTLPTTTTGVRASKHNTTAATAATTAPTATTSTTAATAIPTSISTRPLIFHPPNSCAQHHDPTLRVAEVYTPQSQYPHVGHSNPVQAAKSHQQRIHVPVHDLTFRPQLRKKPRLTSTTTTTRTNTTTTAITDSYTNTSPSAVSSAAPLASPSSVSRQDPIPTHMHKLAATSSVPSFRLALALDVNSSDSGSRPSPSGGLAHPISPLQRANSHPLQRSPSQKQRKPPASHSSYGVETLLGPPPSYSTQRTLSQDRVRNLDRNGSGPRSAPSPTRDTSPAKSNDLPVEPEVITSHLSPVKHEFLAAGQLDSSGDELNPPETSSSVTADTQDLLTPTSSMSKASPLTTEAIGVSDKERLTSQYLSTKMVTEDEGKGSSSDERKSEDLFLNIAKTDATRVGQQSKLDKRRSRISLPFFSNPRPSTSYKSSPIQQQFDTASLSGRSDALHYYSKRSSLGQHVPGALSRAYTHDTLARDGAGSTLEAQSQSPADLARRTMARRYSNTNTDAGRQRPNTARNSRLVSETAFQERSRVADHNATESTISTTAPSTVWDELDDLKSRIRKLELTGKLPPSSAAAMTSSERPKTATTAATTTSSSPKQKPVAAPLQSAVEGIPSTIHPLLHEALGNAKTSLSSAVYQKLQATAQDALQLSLMMHPEAPSGGGSTIGVSSLSERQVRRRTESMCRSLTELAIAILAESKPGPAPVTRPASRDAYQPLSGGLRSRRCSNEPNDRPPVSSRVQSRLDSRRTSVPLGAAFNPQPASEAAYQTPPTVLPPIQTNSSSRIGRTSTSLRTRRTAGYLEGGTDDEEASPSIRPVSRAMTEVSTYRQMARDRAAYSREYTAQHPMPSAIESTGATRSPMPSNLSTNLISRRKYASPGSALGVSDRTPVTPKEAWGRITIVPGAASSPTTEATPESQAGTRATNSRRSLGFASRISSVSSRLRAAKSERSGAVRDSIDTRGTMEMASAGPESEPAGFDRQGSGQSMLEP